MCLAQGPQRSDASEAQTRRQALYHWATALPTVCFVILKDFFCLLIFVQNLLLGIASEFQTVWIQIRLAWGWSAVKPV